MCAQFAKELLRHCVSIIINHTHIHTPFLPGLLWPLLLFYGLTCHDGGMTATLSKREERKWEREGWRNVVSKWMEGEGEKWVSVEKEIGDERQTVKLDQRRERESDKERPDVLTVYTQFSGYNVKDYLCSFMCSACHQLYRVYFVFSTYCTYSF